MTNPQNPQNPYTNAPQANGQGAAPQNQAPQQPQQAPEYGAYGQPYYVGGAPSNEQTAQNGQYGQYGQTGQASQYSQNGQYGQYGEPTGQQPPMYGAYNTQYPNNNGGYYYGNSPYNQAPNDRWNGLVIAGFIFSFLIPIVGLILSIIGLVQINRHGGKSRGMAIAGIIISIAFPLITALTLGPQLANYVDTLESTSSPSTSASASPNTDSNNDDLFEGLNSDGQSAADELEQQLRNGQTLEQALQTPAIAQQLQQAKQQLAQNDMDLDVSAQGNTVVFKVTSQRELSNSAAQAMGSLIKSTIQSRMHDAIEAINDATGNKDAKIQFVFNNANGSSIVNETYSQN